MNKKVLVQIFLFFTFILLSIFFYYEYFKKDSQILDISNSQKIDPTKKDESNLISDLRYFSVDDRGDKYEIKSEYGA